MCPFTNFHAPIVCVLIEDEFINYITGNVTDAENVLYKDVVQHYVSPCLQYLNKDKTLDYSKCYDVNVCGHEDDYHARQDDTVDYKWNGCETCEVVNGVQEKTILPQVVLKLVPRSEWSPRTSRLIGWCVDFLAWQQQTNYKSFPKTNITPEMFHKDKYVSLDSFVRHYLCVYENLTMNEGYLLFLILEWYEIKGGSLLHGWLLDRKRKCPDLRKRLFEEWATNAPDNWF